MNLNFKVGNFFILLIVTVAVVLVFFVCWTPFHAQRLMFVIVTLKGTWTKTTGIAHHVLFLASGVMKANYGCIFEPI